VVAGARLEDAVVTLREAGLRIVAADGRAGRSLDDPEVQARLAGPTAWMFGNEAWGLPPELVALGGRTRRGAHLRPGRESQSGRRGRSVSLRVRACAKNT
jgi:rRNA methylases